MYEELIESLRACGSEDGIARCVYCHEELVPVCNCSNALMRKAADAIEELDTLLDGVSADNDALCETIERLKKPRWIPVTERLPQEREWVLCQCRAKIRMVLRLQNGYWHQDSQHEFMSGFVTHWMPLPAPPKEETE